MAEIEVNEVEPPVTQSAPTIVNVDANPKEPPPPATVVAPPAPDYSVDFAELRAANQRMQDRLDAREDADLIEDDDLTGEGETVVVAAAVAAKGTPAGEAAPAAAPPASAPADDKHAGAWF